MLVDARRVMLRCCSFGEDGDRLVSSSRAWISKPLPVTRADTGLKSRKASCRKKMNILCIVFAVWGRQSCGDSDIIFVNNEVRAHRCIYEKAACRETGKNRLSQTRHGSPNGFDPHPKIAIYSPCQMTLEHNLTSRASRIPPKGSQFPCSAVAYGRFGGSAKHPTCCAIITGVP